MAGVFGETFQHSTDHLNSEGLANVFIILEPFGLSTQGAWFLRSLFLSVKNELTCNLQKLEDEIPEANQSYEIGKPQNRGDPPGDKRCLPQELKQDAFLPSVRKRPFRIKRTLPLGSADSTHRFERDQPPIPRLLNPDS